MIADSYNNTSKRDQFHPGTVLAGIAIGALNPDSKHCYRTSCYAHVTRAIRNGEVLDSDEIVLVGYKGWSNHALVVRDGIPVVDKFGEKGIYDDDAGTYKAPGVAHGTEGVTVSARMTFAAFKHRYNAKTLNDVPDNAEFAGPSSNDNALQDVSYNAEFASPSVAAA